MSPAEFNYLDQPLRDPKFEKTIDRIFRSRDLSGCALVLSRGATVVRKCFGFADEKQLRQNSLQTTFDLGSVSKQFVAYVVFQMVNSEQIKLDQTVGIYLRDLIAQPMGQGTVQQLLEMTGGVPNNFNLPFFIRGHLSKHQFSRQEELKILRDYSLVSTPGAFQNYSNISYNLLAAVCEQVSGKTWLKLLQEYIFEPNGMLNTTLLENKEAPINFAEPFWVMPRFLFFGSNWLVPSPRRNASLTRGAGGIITTIDDFLKWHRGLNIFSVKYPDLAERYFANERSGYRNGWDIRRLRNTRGEAVDLLKHTGQDFGSTSLYFRAASNDSAAILFFNSTGIYNPIDPDERLWEDLKSELIEPVSM